MDDEVADEHVGLLDPRQGLVEVDQVDPAPLTVDEPLHLRVPTAGLVSEVDPGLEQLLHGDDSISHVVLLPFGSSKPGHCDGQPEGGPPTERCVRAEVCV